MKSEKILLLLLSMFFIFGCEAQNLDIQKNANPDPAIKSQVIAEKMEFESIYVGRTNWEAIGETINISKTGEYSFISGRPGIMETKKGNLLDEEINTINDLINEYGIIEMKDAYKGQGYITRSTINYNLKIVYNNKSKEITFKTQDTSVPERLLNFSDKILSYAKE